MAEPHCTWLDVNEHPPRLGRKVLMYTRYGIAIIGDYNPRWANEFITHWMPLPPRPTK